MTEKRESLSHARHPDYQFYDEVHITTVPRWKESELSGNEWRISALIQFKRKGEIIWQTTIRNVEGALRYGDTLITWANEGGLKYIDEVKRYVAEDKCDQEGCNLVATFMYKLKMRYRNDGTSYQSFSPEYRQFCSRHKHRGDCGLDDADNNYELIKQDGEWL